MRDLRGTGSSGPPLLQRGSRERRRPHAVGMKGGARMDFVVRGRGSRVSSQSRERVERKLARLARLNSGIQRIEVELIEEPNRRVNGGHRVEVACWTARRTFRASSTGSDIDAALDRVT